MQSPPRLQRPAPAKKRTRWERGARREQLLQVANKIVARDGVRGLTMERLAEAAKISKPVVYSHFENRSDLLAALLQNYWDETDRSVPNAPHEGQAYEEHLRETVRGHFDVVLNGTGAIRHILHTVIEDPIIEQLRLSREQDLIRRWTKKTLEYFPMSAEQAEHLAILYRGALEAATSYVSRHPRKRSEVEDTCVKMGIASLESVCRRRK